MSAVRLRATVLAGHKQHAVEVPFDPAVKWHIAARAIRPGRRGFAVRARVNGVAFESYVVARARKFWLLLPPSVTRDAGIAVGDEIALALQPESGA